MKNKKKYYNHLCGCGCGREIEIKKHHQWKTSKIPKFLHGHHCKGRKRPDISERMKGENHPLYGKKHSEKTKKLMRENHADFSGKNHPMFGKKRPQLSGKNHPRYKESKKLICKNCEKEFLVKPFNFNKRKFCNHRCFSTFNRGKNNFSYGKRSLILIERNKKMRGEKHPFFNTKRVEHSKKMKGEKNPNWNGGIQYEPYDSNFNSEFKQQIRERDNFTCLKCGKPEYKELQEGKRHLSIHHINYDKKMTFSENCCALCLSCNVEVNYKRNHWQRFFQSILSEKYGYDYLESGEIKLEFSENVK